MQDAANALMAELAAIDQHGFSAEELDDVKSTRLTWLKNAVDQQAERDLRMLTIAWHQAHKIIRRSCRRKRHINFRNVCGSKLPCKVWRKNGRSLARKQDAFWEQMVNNEVAAKKALSPAAILALEKEYANKKLAAYIFQAEIYR